jgi:3-phenylpropionate/cinnamic acid dioxygenase small subunit
LTDEEQVHQAVAEIAHHLDARRFEAWSEMFAEDGGSFNKSVGRSAILEMILTNDFARRVELSRSHATVNVTVDVDGDEAHSESDLLLFSRASAGEPWTFRVGRYVDRFVREDGQWQVADRQTWEV